MDYLLGVLYATKRYEPLDMSKVQLDGTPPLRLRAGFLQSETFVIKSLRGALVVPDVAGAGTGSDKDNDGSEGGGAPPLRRSIGAEPPMSSSPFLPRTLTSGSGRVSATNPRSQSTESHLSSTSLTAGGMPPCPPAAAAAATTPFLPLEGSGGSSSIPGQPSPAITSGAAHNPPGGGNRAAVAAGRPFTRSHRLEYSVPTNVISGKYVLLYLPPPHRPGERAAAALWRSVSASGAAAPTNTGAGASGAGARAHHASAHLQSPQVDLTKPRLSSNVSSSSNFISGMGSHTLSTCGGRRSLSTPRGKSVDHSACTSAAAVGGHHGNHHTSHGGPGCGPSAAAQQAIVRAAAAALSTQQKLLLFYCLLLDSLKHQRPMQRKTSGSLRKVDDDLDTTAVGQAPVAVVELQYTTGEPMRSSTGEMRGTSILGGNTSVCAGADGHGSAVSTSPGVTPVGGAGNTPSPSPGGSRTHAYSLLPGPSPLPTGTHGARGGSMHSGATASSGGGYQTTPATPATPALASPRSFLADTFQANAGEHSMEWDNMRTCEAGTTTAAGLRELVRGGLGNADAVATQRLSSVLRHLLDGQPDLSLSPEAVVFDSEITQNPYYGGWYAVESNDGYRRVVQMCNIQSWPAVVLVDPTGKIVTVEALQHMEEEFARFIDEVDACTAKASATRTTACAASAAAVAASLSAGARSSLASAAVRASGNASSPSPHTSDASQETLVKLQPPKDDEVHSSELCVARRLPSPRKSRAPMALKCTRAPASFADDGATPIDRFSTNSPVASVKVAVDDDDTSTYDSVHTPGRCGSNAAGSTGIREDSVSVLDPHVSTAEPTPMKTAPVTARYRDEGSHPFAASTGAPVKVSTSPMPVSPLLHHASRRNSEFSGGMQQSVLSSGRDGTEGEEGDRQAFGVTKTFRTCLTADQNIPPETLGDTSEEIYERSISLMAEPMSQISSLPQQQQQQQSAPTSPPREFSPSANASRIKGDEAFPSWDAKAYCGDVASVLVVKDLDMDTMTPVFKSQTSWIHASQGAASSAIGEEEARGQAPVVHVPPTHAPLSPTYYEASETVAHETISEHGVAAAPGAFPVPQSPPALLPVFSSRFPWNDVLVDRLMVYALPPLIAKSVGTVTTVPHLALGKGRLDGEKKAVVLTNAQEEEEETNVFETSRGDLSPPLPPSHVGISRTAAPLTRSTRRQSDSEDDREDSSELCRATGSSLAKETGLRRLARSSSANAVTAVVPSSRAFRQAKFSNRSTSISVSGSSSSAAVGEPVSAPSVHETASPQSGEIQKAATEQVELTTLTDSVPPMPSEQCLPLHPLRRLALCTVTAREVRQRAGQSAGDIARSTLEFGNRVEEPSVAPLTQDAVREFVADATSKGSGAPSLSVADSIEDRSSRRTAASRDSPHQPQPPSFVPSAPPDTATQRIMARLLEKWQREMDVKFKWCTHVLILFGAGWHPGMASFLRAVRSLCRVINAPKDALTDAPAFGKEIAPNGCGDERQTHVGLGVPGMRGFDRYLNAEEGDAAPFTSLKGFSESSVEWNGNGAGGFAGGFGGIDSRCDTRSFSSLTGVDAHGGNVSDDGARMAGVSPHGGAATGTSKPAAAALSPSRRVQVIYISADESLQAVCSAMADMPADWLCVSPYVAQSTPEGDLQKHVSDMARSIFRVNSFPRMVVVELPYAQQQHQRYQSENPVRKEAAHAGDSSAESKYGVEDESGDAVGTSTTLHDATAASPNRSEPQFDGLWTVVQLHGENNLCTDPEGKKFPWSSDSADVLRVEEEDVSPALRRRQHEEEVLHPTLSSDPSPLSEGSNPDACEDGLSLRSHAEQVTASGTPTKAVASSKCDAALVKYVVSLYRPVARLFPPIKPFLVADGELPTLLERGGYFVVLGAFGSVDSQLHQQCLSALDEVRQWLYAEIEERKRQAWSEPTQLQVMAPHSAYGGCFTARGDVVVGTPAAYQTTTGGTAGIDEHGLPTRYSPSVAAVTPLNVPTDSGDPFAAAALHRLSLGNSGSRRGSTPMIFEDGWPEARGGTTSPRYGVAGFPMSGSPPIQLDAPSGLHGLRLGGAPSLASAAAAHKANASHRLLPTVYFYDSIFSSVPVPQTLPPTTAPDRCRGAARGRGVHCADEEKSLRGKATPLRQPSPAAAGAPARASPRRRSGGFEGAAAAAAASIPSHAPCRRVFDNTSALRRSHAKDLALFQEYILSPILESDGRQLPVREGEVYLACVRWPQRTCAVLQSCLGSEARPPAPVLATAVGSTAPLTAASTSSTTAGGLVCGGNVCPTPGSGTGLRSLTVSHSPGAGQLLPEPILRRSSVSSGVSPPTNSPLTAAPASGNVTAAASAAAAGGNHVSSNLSATFSPAPVPSSASPAETHSESGSAGGTTTGLNSPPLASTNMHISAFTSLSNTILIEEHGKEGSPDPEATPLASAESIKSFLYDNILRLMEA